MTFHYTDFLSRNAEMRSEELDDSMIRLISFRWFADGNFKLRIGNFFKRFFLCACFHLHADEHAHRFNTSLPA